MSNSVHVANANTVHESSKPKPPVEKVPHIIKVLFKKMDYKTYKEKLNNPIWFYKTINL